MTHLDPLVMYSLPWLGQLGIVSWHALPSRSRWRPLEKHSVSTMSCNDPATARYGTLHRWSFPIRWYSNKLRPFLLSQDLFSPLQSLGKIDCLEHGSVWISVPTAEVLSSSSWQRELLLPDPGAWTNFHERGQQSVQDTLYMYLTYVQVRVSPISPWEIQEFYTLGFTIK